MADAVLQHQFTDNGWETVENAWNIPARRICVSPHLPLRVKSAFFITASSSDGCIEYGGGTSLIFQRVQVKGQRGQTVQVRQTLPVGG